MNKLLTIFTMIPWILYYIEIYYYRISVIEKYGTNDKKYFNHINKSFFESINIKELILFFIFIIFLQFGKVYVLKILFIFFYIYLLFDFFMTLAEKCTKIKNKFIMVQTVILCILLIGSYLVFRKVYLTYILMFIASILSSFIVYAFAIINNKVFK